MILAPINVLDTIVMIASMSSSELQEDDENALNLRLVLRAPSILKNNRCSICSTRDSLKLGQGSQKCDLSLTLHREKQSANVSCEQFTPYKIQGL